MQILECDKGTILLDLLVDPKLTPLSNSDSLFTLLIFLLKKTKIPPDFVLLYLNVSCHLKHYTFTSDLLKSVKVVPFIT